ncbi:MAG: hypothetical protein WEA61_09540 [Anaerolineales bacterium]
MSGIETLFNSLPGHWVVLGLITAIGLSVIFVRGLIRLFVRAFIIGVIGVILLGAVYLTATLTGISL